MFPLKDIQPNPFRQLDRYPTKQKKIDALRESFRATGFWDNLVARLNADGLPEIAYGHTRLAALKAEYEPDHEIGLIVRGDLSDEAMLQIMARENMEEWGADVLVELETVRAVVEAYAAGRVKLATPSNKARYVRYAPSFCAGSVPAQNPYTALSVARFVGWVYDDGQASDKVKDALAALELIEVGALDESQLAGRGRAEAHAIITEVRKAKAGRDAEAERKRQQAEREANEAKAARERDDAKAAERAERRAATATAAEQEERQRGRDDAQLVAGTLSSDMADGRVTWRGAEERARKALGKRKQPKVPPDLDSFAANLAKLISKTLTNKDSRYDDLQTLLRPRVFDGLSDRRRRDLAIAFERLADRATKYGEQFREDDSIEVDVITEPLAIAQPTSNGNTAAQIGG